MSQEDDARFTLSIVSENEVGALLRMTMTLARHRIRVESLTSTSDESAGVHRHIVVARARPDRVRRAMKQIQASVGVLAAEYYAEGETVDREVALYKLDVDRLGDPDSFRDLVRARRARVLVLGETYVIIEKTGCGREIEELYESLRPFGVMQFVRSGRIMVTKAGPAETAGARASSGNRANGG